MAKRRAEYRLAPAAERDLEGIWLYTLEEWGIEQAHRYTDELAAAFDQLARKPKLGTSCDYIRKGYRRSRVGRHAIYFRITDYGIAVIRVLHDRMDAARGTFDGVEAHFLPPKCRAKRASRPPGF